MKNKKLWVSILAGVMAALMLLTLLVGLILLSVMLPLADILAVLG